MNSISPTAANIWVWLSIAVLVVNLVFFVTLIFVALALVRMLKDVQPKLAALTDRVDKIGKHVEELAISAKTTVEGVGGRAQSLATSVDSIAHAASSSFERFSPFVVGALTAMRLVKALMQMKQGVSPAKATSKKALERGKKKK